MSPARFLYAGVALLFFLFPTQHLFALESSPNDSAAEIKRFHELVHQTCLKFGHSDPDDPYKWPPFILPPYSEDQ